MEDTKENKAPTTEQHAIQLQEVTGQGQQRNIQGGPGQGPQFQPVYSGMAQGPMPGQGPGPGGFPRGGQPGFVQPGYANPFAGGQGQFRPGPGQPGQPQMGFQGGGRPPQGFGGQPYGGQPYGGQPGSINQPLLGAPQDRFAGDNKGLHTMEGGGGSGGAYGSVQACCGNCQGCLATWLPCICCCFKNPYEIVPQGYSGIVARFGKFYKIVGPGMHFINQDLDALILIDKREQVVELKRQAVVSRDNTTFGIDAVVYYKVVDTYKSKYAVSNLKLAIDDLAVTTLRNVIGKFTLQEFLEKRDAISEQVEHTVTEPAFNWGAQVHRVLVQDVYLSNDSKAAFSTGALSKKIGEAQVIIAQADVQSAKLMKEAADALNTEAALQIRYIDALDAVSKSSNPKMIFFPADYREVGTANPAIEEEVQKYL